MGESGILVTPAAPFTLAVQQRLWQVREDLLSAGTVLEAVPGIGNLLLVFSPLEVELERVCECVRAAWDAAMPQEKAGRLHEVSMTYGGADMDAVAAHVGLSIEQFAERHSAPEYVVLTVGAQPGYGYLWGMPEELAVPRKSVPALEVMKGSLVVGGSMTSVITATSPSGWNIIGHTDEEFFNPTRAMPSRLMPGDRVRFILAGLLR